MTGTGGDMDVRNGPVAGLGVCWTVGVEVPTPLFTPILGAKGDGELIFGVIKAAVPKMGVRALANPILVTGVIGLMPVFCPTLWFGVGVDGGIEAIRTGAGLFCTRI